MIPVQVTRSTRKGHSWVNQCRMMAVSTNKALGLQCVWAAASVEPRKAEVPPRPTGQRPGAPGDPTRMIPPGSLRAIIRIMIRWHDDGAKAEAGPAPGLRPFRRLFLEGSLRLGFRFRF